MSRRQRVFCLRTGTRRNHDLDGTGEDTTTLFSQGQGTRIKVLKRIKLPHSLGQFYSAVTNYIGFDMFAGDEWKLMGLAAYGKPDYYDFFAGRS